MNAKTIVITGASDGIGAAAARQLADLGHTVVIVGRSEAKTYAIATELNAAAFTADFTDLEQVVDLAAGLRERYPRIDVLANNAGGIFREREITPDGFEKTFQVNHLAPFLLTDLLLDTLIASRASIINTSSIAAKIFGKVDLDDLNNEHDSNPNRAYGNGKLANILHVRGLHQRYHDRGLSTAAFHPGVVGTNFASETTSAMRLLYQTPLRHLLTISPEKGADTLVWLANGTPGSDWESGQYYEKRKIAKTNPQASDDSLVNGLWDLSVEMLARRMATR